MTVFRDCECFACKADDVANFSFYLNQKNYIMRQGKTVIIRATFKAARELVSILSCRTFFTQ